MAPAAQRSSNPKSDFYDPEYALEQELAQERQRLGNRTGARDDEEEKILDPRELAEIVKDTVNAAKPPPDELSAATKAGYRMRDARFDWPMPSIIGSVTRKGMASLTAHALQNAIDAARAVQTTGDWRVAAVVVQEAHREKEIVQIKDMRGQDVKVSHFLKERVLLVAVRLIDLRNGEEVVYKNGRPTVDDQIPSWVRAMLDDRFRPAAEPADQAAVVLQDENKALRDRLDRLEALLLERSEILATAANPIPVPEDTDEVDPETWDPADAPAQSAEELLSAGLDAAMREAPEDEPKRRGPGRPRKDRGAGSD